MKMLVDDPFEFVRLKEIQIRISRPCNPFLQTTWKVLCIMRSALLSFHVYCDYTVQLQIAEKKNRSKYFEIIFLYTKPI